ncbi:ABC transporter permease [Microlunatus sp. GCM10028923]|uniref:ABC transporter permease n=1 Tax=Microlunatus sp. GCM10028923 TaxID=3273400 RepID=UPI0036168A50
MSGWVLTKRELLHWVRQPWAPIFNLAFIVLLLIMFGVLLGGAIQIPGGGGGNYMSYLLPGMFTLAMMFGLEGTMTAMANDAKRGITDRFRSMPIGSTAVTFGRIGADMITSVVELVVLIGGGLLLGWRAGGSFGAAVVAVLLLLWLRFALLWFGVFLGLTIRGDGAQTAVSVLVWPIGFLSNLFVSPETMPGWLAAVASWNPLSATAAATRQLFGNPTGITAGPLADYALIMAFGWPLLITAIFLPLSARAYRRLRH